MRFTTLKSAFPKSFDTLGNFREEYRLTVDPTVAPVVDSCRKYAIHRREAIHDELNKLDVRVNLVQFSSDQVEQLREETARDPVLVPLRDIIVSG